MRWKAYLRLGRVSNLPTVWTNTLAGLVLQGGDLSARALVPLCAAISLMYVGGMFLNDAFDRHFDARQRPERPIPSGLVGASEVFGAGYGMLGLGLLVLVTHGLWSGTVPAWHASVSGLALALLIIFYNARHKGNPFAPAIMGLCRVLVYVTAALAVGPRLQGDVIRGSLVLLSYLIGLTYVAGQETLSRFRVLWPLAFLAAPFVYGLPAVAGSPAGAIIYAGFLLWVFRSIAFLVGRGRHDIQRAVIGLIAGISLLDALLIAGRGRPLAAGAAALGFIATLSMQRFVRGT